MHPPYGRAYLIFECIQYPVFLILRFHDKAFLGLETYSVIRLKDVYALNFVQMLLIRKCNALHYVFNACHCLFRNLTSKCTTCVMQQHYLIMRVSSSFLDVNLHLNL
jgi:hypothetical protein